MVLVAGRVTAGDQICAPEAAEAFVPLSEAAALAYSRIKGSHCLVRDLLGDGLHLGAIALVTMVPVYISTRSADRALLLHESEACDLMFCALSAGMQPDLTSLMVRRSDLALALRALERRSERRRSSDWE